MSRSAPIRGALRLTVHAIENLRHNSGFPYVRVAVASQQHQTNPSSGGPINASFNFTVGSERGEDQYLTVEVRDDAMKGNQVIGNALVPLAEIAGWRGMHRVDIVAGNGVELCGTVVLTAEFTADNSAHQPSMYPAVSPRPAYNPAFYGGSPSSSEPPPPYQAVDPYAPQLQPPQQYSPGPNYSPQSQPPPQYSPQPSPARALPAQPVGFFPPASNATGWPAQPPPMQPAPPQTVTQTVMLPPFGVDVKDPRHHHPLRHMPTLYNGTGYQCNLCRRENNANGFHCSICNYDMCPACFAQQAVGGPTGGPARDVRHQHPLYWQRLTGAGYRNGFRCDGCGNAGRDQAWHCGVCSFDLHAQCLRPVR